MTASLRPVAGDPRDVYALVERWVREGGEPIVIRTSGSTGEPKDVVLSHAAVMASAHASLDRLGGPGGWVQAMPVTGVGGLQVLVRSAIAGLEPVYAAEHSARSPRRSPRSRASGGTPRWCRPRRTGSSRPGRSRRSSDSTPS